MRYVQHIVAAALLLAPSAVCAQTRFQPVTPVAKPITLSTSPQLVANANQNRVTLSIQNLDATIEVCYSYTSTTPTCGSQGSYTIIGKSLHFFPAGSTPNTALYMVAASGSPAVSVTEGF